MMEMARIDVQRIRNFGCGPWPPINDPEFLTIPQGTDRVDHQD
jgi:hypothetical protein